MVYLELWASKKEEYTRNKGNATGEFEWKVYEKCNGKKELKAGFVKEIEAREYASFLESCNKVARYNESKFRVEYVLWYLKYRMNMIYGKHSFQRV